MRNKKFKEVALTQWFLNTIMDKSTSPKDLFDEFDRIDKRIN